METIKIKCTNPECGHEWEYKGESKFYVTCPHCYRKINLNKLDNSKEKKK